MFYFYLENRDENENQCIIKKTEGEINKVELISNSCVPLSKDDLDELDLETYDKNLSIIGLESLLEKYNKFIEEQVDKNFIIKNGKRAINYSENARKIR